MHFCKANVAIGGDPRNIMNRGEFSPVSWPEIEVLRTIHGDSSIDQIIPFVEVNQPPRAERDRLVSIYGDEPVKNIWGGRAAPTEMGAPDVRQKPDIIWINPLSGQMEKTTKDGSVPYTPPVEKRSAAEIVGNYAVRDDAMPASLQKTESEMYSDDDYPEGVVPVAEEDPTAAETPKTKKK